MKHLGLSEEEQDGLSWESWRDCAVRAMALDDMEVQRVAMGVGLGIAKAFRASRN